MIKSIPINAKLQSPELNKRLQECISRRSKKTKFYETEFSNQVVGYIALDRWPEIGVSKLVIYELFIESKFQLKGYGLRIIEDVKEIAKNEEYDYLGVSPCEIANTSLEDILRFYKKCGFIESDISGELILKINP